MKRLLLLLAILGLMYSHLSSQTAEEYFSTEGLSINSYHFNAFDGTYSTALTYYDKIMLCGEEVLRFYRNDSGIPFYLKIEGQKGYRVFGSCSTRLLFDYDLEVGEVVPEGFYQNFVVTDKYPVTLLNGEQRMRFDLDQNGYTISWIEGVGDIQNGLFPIFEDFEGYDVYVCTKIGDELLWQNEEEAAFCDILACAKPQIRYNASIDEYLLSVDNHSIFADVFEWDFGDGNQSSEKDPTHQYDAPGCYSLSLLVGNDCHTNDPRFLENVPVCFADTWEVDYVVDTFGSMYVHRFSDELEFTHAFYGPYLHRSTDGGQTWQPIELPSVANGVQRLIYEIKMFDANRGVMACGHYGADSDQKAILVTQDGGLTWEEKVPGSYFLRNLEVTEDGKAWVMGSNNYIYRSLDYGESWETLQYPALSIRTVQYINESLLIGNGYTGIQPWQETYLIKSYDDGLTWDTLNIPNNLSSWHFFNENLGYAKQGTQMAKTTDGGLSWELLDLGFGVARFSFATPNAGWIVDQTGLIHYTNDAMQSFLTGHCQPEGVRHIEAISKDEAFTVHRGAGGIGIKKTFNINLDPPDCFTTQTNAPTSVENAKLRAYPNPVRDILQIEVDAFKAAPCTLQIINGTGQIIRTVVYDNIDNIIEVDFSELPNGVYQLLMTDGIIRQSAGVIKVD